MERTGEGADPRRDRRVEVHLRAADHPDRRSRAVLLVVGVDDEEHVQHPHRLRFDAVRLDRGREHHVEEVRAVREVVTRIDHRFADRLLVGERRHGAHDRDHPRTGDVEVVRHRLDVHIGVERGHRVDHRGEDVHRMRALGHVVEEVPHVLVQQTVLVELLRKEPALGRIRQLPVDQQVGDVHEHRLLDQLLYRYAAITQHSVFTVDVGDAAHAGRGVGKPRIERHESALLPQRGDVQRPLALGAYDYRQPYHLTVDFQFRKFLRLRSHDSHSPIKMQYDRKATVIRFYPDDARRDETEL